MKKLFEARFVQGRARSTGRSSSRTTTRPGRGRRRASCGSRSCWFRPRAKRLHVEALVLEVEVAHDAAHHLVVNAPDLAQLNDGPALSVQELAAQALVVRRPFFGRAVRLGVDAREKALAPEAVEAAHPLRGVLAHPLFVDQLLQS